MKHFSLLISLLCLIEPANSREVFQSEPDSRYMAELIHLSDRLKLPYPDFYRINPGLPEGVLYSVQKEYVGMRRNEGATIAGFKGGFTSTQPIGGVLFTDGLVLAGTTIERKKYVNLVIEAEIGFRFCTTVDKILKDKSELQKAVCELIPALEIADARLSDFDNIRRNFSHLRTSLIPLNILAKQFVLGVPVPSTQIDLQDLDVTTSVSKTEIGRRLLTEKSDIWSDVLWVVNSFIVAEGYNISPGQIILPGNLTGIHAGQVGNWRADFQNLGSVQIEVK